MRVKALNDSVVSVETLHKIKLEKEKDEDYDGKPTQYLQLKVEYNTEKAPTCYSGKTQIFFKNQFVCNFEPESYPFVNLKLNFMSGRTLRWLSLDRNSIRVEQQRWLQQFIRETLARELKNGEFPDEQKASLSLLYYVFLKDNHKDGQLPEWLKDKWRVYKIEKLEKAIGDILDDYKSFEILLGKTDILRFENGILQMSEYYLAEQYNLWIMLVVVFKERMKKVGWFDDKIIFSEKDNSLADNYRFTIEVKEWKHDIEQYIKDSKYNHVLLPCKGKYTELAIDASKTAKVCPQFLPFDLDSNCENLMISPFMGDGKGKNIVVSDAFIDFVQQNLLQIQKIKKEKIRSLYQEFIEDYGQAKPAQ